MKINFQFLAIEGAKLAPKYTYPFKTKLMFLVPLSILQIVNKKGHKCSQLYNTDQTTLETIMSVMLE